MLKIAWRNVLRNKRRSLLSLLIIVIGVTVLFLVKGYITSTYAGLKMMSVAQYGNLQIAKEGYWDNRDNQRHLLTESEIAEIKGILAENEDIIDYTTELSISGILGTEKGSTIVSGIGVEPGSSQRQNIIIKNGTNLFAGDKSRILLGEGIMKKLNLKVDEWVSIMATTIDGAYNAGSLQVTGSFSMGNADADNFYIMLPISFAQNLLNTDGVDKFIVNLKDTEMTTATVNWLKNRFDEMGLRVEIKSWSDLAAYYHQVRGLYEIIFFFLSTVIFILVFLSILEIMSMAFFERMEEIGTIRAIGTKRHQVFLLLIQEGLILGILGGLIGIASGWGVGYLINQLHVTYTPPSMSEPVRLYVALVISNGFIPFFIVVISAVLSALYPAIKASRLNIVEMLRHV